MKLHVTEDGPKKCIAEIRECKYGADNHFRSMKAATEHYETVLASQNSPFFSRKAKITALKTLYNVDKIFNNMNSMYKEIPVQQAVESIENGFKRFAEGGFLPHGLKPRVRKQGKHVRLDVDNIDSLDSRKFFAEKLKNNSNGKKVKGMTKKRFKASVSMAAADGSILIFKCV